MLHARFDQNRLQIFGETYAPVFSKQPDYFRMFLDDGEFREIPVHSMDQTPSGVSYADGILTIRYETVRDIFGRDYPIRFTVKIREEGDAIHFSSEIDNHSDVRVNEVMLPYLSFADLGCPAEEEICYLPTGVGWIKSNIRHYLESNQNTEYVHADHREILMPQHYPGQISMSWGGIQAGGHFIYFGAHDTSMRMISLNVGTNPRQDPESRLILSVSHYPAVCPGETVEPGESRLAVFAGNWKDGAHYYRKWCDDTWYVPHEKPLWVKNMTGWQRIIMKHQYGEIYYRYKDLPDLFENGMRYGINTLLVFGWWKGCFDNHYPEYEPDPELGGEEELKAAIRRIHEKGGHVHLYTNGNLIDIKTDYYRSTGRRICTKDLDGNEYRDHYRFSNEGTLLREFGYKSFVHACHCTEEWRDCMISLADQRLGYGADSVFYDQLCTCCNLCFDASHPHGNRVDLDPEARRTDLLEIRKRLGPGQAVGSEDVVDRYSTLLDYNHGCTWGMSYDPGAFPELFRETFPECIISNRYIHDEHKGWKKAWNYAFAYNLIFDVSMNRGRSFDISGYPETGRYLKELIDLKHRYHEFFYGGIYHSAADLNLPWDVYAANYESGGSYITAIANNTGTEQTLFVYDTEVTVPSDACTVVFHP